MNKDYNIEDIGAHINYSIEKTSNLPNRLTDEYILKDYQENIAKIFLGLDSFRKFLMYWETGSGKTIAIIYILKYLKTLYPSWHIFLLIKASIHNHPWKINIDKFLKNYEFPIEFIHYDNPNIIDVLKQKISKINTKASRILFIIDESHNFISMSRNINNKTRYTKKIYNMIYELTKRGNTNRLILITATPIINDIEEFNLLTNLLRHDYNVSSSSFFSYNNRAILLNKKKLIHYLLGSVSYYKFNDLDVLEESELQAHFPRKKIIYKDIIMSQYQSQIYKDSANLEIKTNTGGFRMYRRLASTFTYGSVKDKKKNDIEKMQRFVKQYSDFMFSDEFKDHFINDNLKEYISKTSVHELQVFQELKSFSCKYIEACYIILKSNGKCLVYEPFTSFEGISTLQEYFKIFDISYTTYMKYTNTRDEDLIRFNANENTNGEIIKCCVFSSAGVEAISFFNINELIILDIPWSDSKLKQIIGRGIRYNSHINLPVNRQYINVYIIISYTIDKKHSVDKEILDILLRKHKELKELYDVLKMSSLEIIKEISDNSNINHIKKEQDIFIQLEAPINDVQVNLVEQIQSKILTFIYYSSDDYKSYSDGYLDKTTNKVYKDMCVIGYIKHDDFILIDSKLVYKLYYE